MASADGRIIAARDGRDGPSTSKGGLVVPQSSTDLSSNAPTKSISVATSSATTATTRDRERKIGHRRVDETTGQVTYKKKATTDLMKAIQLGIGQSVGSLTSKPERDVLMQDFSVVETVNFPENGSNLTPAHRVGEFKFKTYAPVAFRYFRELFGIHMDDFLVSLCSDTLRELSNPGASGSIFFITEDDEFIIKTVQHKEAEFLQKLLPGYYMNLNQNPRTLLPKFYGLHCHQQGGKNIRFVIMNNLLPSSVKLHEKYDLKGSTHKRKASKYELEKSSPTLKDLDFRDRHPEGLLLEPDTHDALLKTIRRDCRVLESFKIMDYSLLLGVHNIDQARRERSQMSLAASGASRMRVSGSGALTSSAAAKAQALSAELAILSEAGTGSSALGAGAGVQRNRSVRQRLANFSTAMESIQAEADVSVDLEDDEEATPAGGIPARSASGDRLLLYVGIIDILQSYRLKKKLEHGFKSIVHDGDTISVHRPGFYAQRFQSFFDKEVFKKLPAPQRSPSRKKLARQRSVTESGMEMTTAGAGPGALSRLSLTDTGKQGGLSSSRPDLIVAATTPHRDAEPAAAASIVESKPAADPHYGERKQLPPGSITVDTGNAADVEAPAIRRSAQPQLSEGAAAAVPSPGPPVGGDHLPPYSEHHPAVAADVQPVVVTKSRSNAIEVVPSEELSADDAALRTERESEVLLVYRTSLAAHSLLHSLSDTPTSLSDAQSSDLLQADDSGASFDAARSIEDVVVTIRLPDDLDDTTVNVTGVSAVVCTSDADDSKVVVLESLR